MLYGILGVSEADIRTDYALTSYSTSGIRSARSFDKMVKSTFGSAPGKTLNDKLVAYVLECGFTMADIAASHAVVVEAGGFLSGTGTVNNVSIAAGGGFAATAGQKGMLTIAGDATVPATGVVEIANPRGMDTNRILVKFATVAGALTIPDDLSGWTVKVDGVTMPPGFALLRQGNTLLAGCVQGTMLIFR